MLFLAALTLMTCPLLRADCSLTSTGIIPLNDLGPGSYQGFTAGLYPAGFDMPPAAHAAAAFDIATNQIKPLDASGNPNPVNGRIVMISVGMSNTTQEFASKGTQNFKLRADADPAKNPQLVIVDGAQGGQDATAWIDPSAPTWTTVNQRLAAAGVTQQQVQVCWLKQALAGPHNYGAFPAHAQTLQSDLEIILRNLKTKFPNIQITYLSTRSRAYTNTPTDLNPEPFAYETGFAVKWTIEDQINGTGNLNFDPARGAVVAPITLWGPYIWADGLTPRSDGFIWLCSDLESDFTHPTASGGVPKVASQLLAFFKTDPTATPWFLNRTVTGQPPTVTASASFSNGVAPLSVSFMANAVDPDGQIVAYQWTFDDGTFSTTQNPAKIFPAPGNYSVHLTVTDNSGNTTLRTLPISVASPQNSPTPAPTATSTPASTPTPTPGATATPTPSLINISGTITYCSNPVPGPVPNVTLTITGNASGSTLSDASGNYMFSALAPGGNYAVTPAKATLAPGSAGINTVDVLAVQRHVLNLALLTGCRLMAADVTGDTVINTADVIAIQRFALGLPAGIANAGRYRFHPLNRTYPGLVNNQAAQNYDALVFGDVASPFAE
jgi:PKD repeat protein